MKDMFLGMVIGFIIGVLITIIILPNIDMGAFAEVQNIIQVQVSDSVGISEVIKN